MAYDENGNWIPEPGPVVNVPNVGATTGEKIDDIYSTAQDKVGLLSTPNTASTYVAPTQQQAQDAGAQIKDASTYMKDDYSVSGQLSKLLNSNSDYMKQVDAKSKMQANSVGMLSSDRAVAAGTGAAIRESLPIAQANAEIASKFGYQQQQAENTLATTQMEGLVSGSLKSQEYDLQNKSNQFKSNLDMLMKSADVQSEVALTNVKGQWDFAIKDSMARLENQLNTAFMQNEYNQQTKENTRAQATSQIENTMISIESILKDPDILQLGSGAVANLVNNEIAMMRSGIELTYNMAGLNVDGYITDLLADFEDTYDWTGVDQPDETTA